MNDPGAHVASNSPVGIDLVLFVPEWSKPPPLVNELHVTLKETLERLFQGKRELKGPIGSWEEFADVVNEARVKTGQFGVIVAVSGKTFTSTRIASSVDTLCEDYGVPRSRIFAAVGDGYPPDGALSLLVERQVSVWPFSRFRDREWLSARLRDAVGGVVTTRADLPPQYQKQWNRARQAKSVVVTGAQESCDRLFEAVNQVCQQFAHKVSASRSPCGSWYELPMICRKLDGANLVVLELDNPYEPAGSQPLPDEPKALTAPRTPRSVRRPNWDAGLPFALAAFLDGRGKPTLCVTDAKNELDPSRRGWPDFAFYEYTCEVDLVLWLYECILARWKEHQSE